MVAAWLREAEAASLRRRQAAEIGRGAEGCQRGEGDFSGSNEGSSPDGDRPGRPEQDINTKLVVVLIAGMVALVSAACTALNAGAIEQLKIDNKRRTAEEQRRKEISGYSERLAHAAYDLGSRLYDIVRQDLVVTYLVNGDDRQKSYVVENTVFLIAQYLCWTELVRREIQFIDPGVNDKTHEPRRLQDTIYSLWGRTGRQSPLFRIFAGEQRAMGEALIQPGEHGPECTGYGAFLKAFAPGVNPLIDAIRQDVTAPRSGLGPATERLTNLQHSLIDLLSMLDPDYLRFPENRRSKL